MSSFLYEHSESELLQALGLVDPLGCLGVEEGGTWDEDGFAFFDEEAATDTEEDEPPTVQSHGEENLALDGSRSRSHHGSDVFSSEGEVQKNMSSSSIRSLSQRSPRSNGDLQKLGSSAAKLQPHKFSAESLPDLDSRSRKSEEDNEERGRVEDGGFDDLADGNEVNAAAKLSSSRRSLGPNGGSGRFEATGDGGHTSEIASPPFATQSTRARRVSQAPLLVAGATTQEADERDGVPNSWSDGDASEFKVRAGPNYNRTKRKQVSKESLYRQIGMDMFRNTYDDAERIKNIGAHVKLPESRLPELPAGCPFPRIIVCNLQVPMQAPKMFGKSDPDAGISIVLYYEIKRSTLDLLENEESAQSPSIKLLNKFFTDFRHSEDMQRRFKVIGLVHNTVEVGVPAMFQSYNGKPAIIFKTGKIYSGSINGNPQDQYVEFDVCVHDFAYLARKALHAMIDRAPQMRLRCAFIVQGETDEELPEQVFACSAVHKLNLHSARPVNLPPHDIHAVHKSRTFA